MSNLPTPPNLVSSDIDVLFQAAIKCQNNAYSPYSHHKVGSAVKLANGKIYAGCNIENASFGATICAERVALTKAFSEEGPQWKVQEILVISDTEQPWTPCGLCQQVLSEFTMPQTLIHLATKNGVQKTLTWKEIQPYSFDQKMLSHMDGREAS